MKRLQRSVRDRVFSGVCGGMGEYFGISSVLVRLAFVFWGLASFGMAVLLYLICAFIIPEGDSDSDVIYSDSYKTDNGKQLVGIALILVGIVLLAKKILPFFNINFRFITMYFSRIFGFWPILLILLGVYIIFSKNKD